VALLGKRCRAIGMIYMLCLNGLALHLQVRTPGCCLFQVFTTGLRLNPDVGAATHADSATCDLPSEFPYLTFAVYLWTVNDLLWCPCTTLRPALPQSASPRVCRSLAAPAPLVGVAGRPCAPGKRARPVPTSVTHMEHAVLTTQRAPIDCTGIGPGWCNLSSMQKSACSEAAPSSSSRAS